MERRSRVQGGERENGEFEKIIFYGSIAKEQSRLRRFRRDRKGIPINSERPLRPLQNGRRRLCVGS
jgi:hypothetical protein